jgi:hypothetical protein
MKKFSPQSAAGATNYVLHVTIVNSTSEPVEFRPDSVDVVDAVVLKPGQKIEGPSIFRRQGRMKWENPSMVRKERFEERCEG